MPDMFTTAERSRVMRAVKGRGTGAEDRFLHENLAGYPQYARRVPHRVLPGIW